MAAWYLVSEKQSGNGADQHKYRLRQQMIFVGREDCEMVLQSRSVDKQHAVIKYDLAEDVYKVKDLGSLNGTFLNESRIPEETYVTLHKKDTLRFGYDHHVFRIEHLEDKGEPWELKQLKSELVARRLKGRRSYSPPFYHAHCEVGKSAYSLCSGHISHSTGTTCGHEVYQAHDSYTRPRDSASPAYEQKDQSAKGPPLNGSRVRDMRRSPVSSVDIGIQTNEECVSQAEDNVSEEGTAPHAAESSQTHGQTQTPLPVAQSPEVESPLRSESTQPESESSRVQETTESPLSLTSESTGTPSDLTPHAKRGTPLYGQPQWWGETEEGVGSGPKVNGRGHKDLPVREGNGDGRAGPSPAGSTNLRREQKERDAVLERMDETRREHKYFEIPATDFQQTEVSPMDPSGKDMSELKKKDSHLCFTVNLDDTSPLKLSVGDSVSKFAPSHRQQRKERTEGVGADETMSSPRGMHRRRRSEHLETEREGSRQVEIMFSGSWRRGPAGQSDVTDDDSVHSDMPVSSRSKTGSQHIDGTRSESETESRHPHLQARVRQQEEQQGQQQEMSPLAQADLHRRKKITPEDMLLDQRSFTVDFYDRKTPSKAKYPDCLKEKKGGVRASVEKVQTRKSTEGAAPKQGKAEKAGEKDSGSRPSSGKKRQSKEDAQDHPVDPDKDVCEEDKTSDAGTYTIELDEPNPEVEEARRKIDEVFGVTEPGEPQKAAKGVESPTEPGIQGPGVENQQADHPASSAEAESGGFGQVEVIFTGSWKRASQQPKQRPVGPIAPGAPSWVHQWVSADQTTSPSAEGEQAGMLPTPSVVVTDRDVIGMDHQKPPMPRRKLSDASSQESPKTGRKRRTLPAIPSEKPTSQPSSRTTTPPLEKSTYPPGSVTSEESRHRERASELLEGERRIRRGSFTLDEDTPSLLKELQPSGGHKDDTMKVLDAASDVSLDTAVLLKDTDSVIAALESRVKARHAEAQSQLEGSRRSPVGHVGRGRESSGESDMDTVSTTSVADGDVGLIKSKSASRRSLSSQYWEKSHDGDKLRDTSAKQRLRESRRSDPYGDRSSTISDVLSSDADTQVGRSSITEKGGGTAFHIEFSAGSPEFSRGTPSRRSLGRGEKKSRPTDLQKSTSMEVNKSGTFPKPRPTRASLLRRNRLESDSARSGPDSSGELEDYPETPSEASTASTSSTSSRPRPSSAKSSREMEMQARLDRLSKPRAGRVKDPPKSDRSDLSLGGQIVKVARASSGQPKQGSVRASPQAKTRTASGQGHSRSKSISSVEKGGGSSVWRRKSDAVEASGGNVWRRRKDHWEDHGSRSSTESAGDTTDRSESRVKRSKSFGDSARALRRGDRKKSTSNEGLHKSRKGYTTTPDSGRSTTDEISRLSQQLAADLAILAQGAESDDGAKHVPKKRMDSKEKPKYATLPRAAKASKAAKHLTGIRKPRKELHLESKGSKLVERIFEDSMSKQPKSGGGTRGGSDREKESPTSSKRRQWRKEEPLDNLVITSVHRLSQKIKLTIDRTVAKARHVYGPDQPLPDVKSRDDADLPMLKSSNQEIAAILGNLRRVERQIEVLDRLIDPDDQIPVDSTEEDSSSTLVGGLPASTPSSAGHRTPVSEYEQKTRSWQAADRSLSEQSEGMDSEDGEFDIHFNRFHPSGDEDFSTME